MRSVPRSCSGTTPTCRWAGAICGTAAAAAVSAHAAAPTSSLPVVRDPSHRNQAHADRVDPGLHGAAGLLTCCVDTAWQAANQFWNHELMRMRACRRGSSSACSHATMCAWCSMHMDACTHLSALQSPDSDTLFGSTSIVFQPVEGDCRNPESLKAAVAGVDAICCCTGTTAFPSKR